MKRKRSKNAWIWENIKGKRALFVIAIFGTVVYNVMQLTVPYFSRRIIDEFLTGEDAVLNMQLHRDVFFQLIISMVALTFIRTVVVYLDCMAYEYVSQSVLSNVRNYMFNKMQYQDMTFYSTDYFSIIPVKRFRITVFLKNY